MAQRLLKPKPKIKPSKLLKKPKKKFSQKRPGSAKRKKTVNLEIHETTRIAPESIPSGSEFKGLRPFTVQGLEIRIFNTLYQLEEWKTPDGKSIVGKLPNDVMGILTIFSRVTSFINTTIVMSPNLCF